MKTLPWLVVGEDAGEIWVFSGIWSEGGETLENVKTDYDPDPFASVEQSLRDLRDLEGRPIWQGEHLTWRLGTDRDAMILGARCEDTDHTYCGWQWAPMLHHRLPGPCECGMCQAGRQSKGH